MSTEPRIQKPCGVCKQWKDLDCFSPQVTGTFGRHTYCKPCRSKANLPQATKWKLDNPERARKISKAVTARRSLARKQRREKGWGETCRLKVKLR